MNNIEQMKQTVSKAIDDMLKSRDKELTALENGGVDNWQWYEEALKDLENEKE